MIGLYCRVSTDEQAREGISLEEQKQRLTSYCRAMGWIQEYKLYIDDGYSAKSLERPNIQQLIDDVKNKKLSKVVVTKLDRISRRLSDLIELIETFYKCEVSFTSISESFDTHTPSGRLTLHVLGAVAEFERERIRERVVENMHHAAKKGKWLTQHPYGYRIEGDSLIIHEPEANVVKDIYSMYLDKGLGFYTIAKKLNGEGMPSRHNKEWSIRSIKLLLENPVYKGTMVWNKRDSSTKNRQLKDKQEWVTVEDCLPVIIDKSRWNLAQEKLSRKKVHPRSKTSPHLLGGLLKCGKCGAGMSIGWSGSTNRYRVYRCSANKNKGTCKSKQYRANDVEEWFKFGINRLVEDFAFNLIPELIENESLKPGATTLQQRVKTAKNRYKRKLEAYTSGVIELEELTKEKQKLDELQQEIPLSEVEFDYEEILLKVKTEIKTVIDAMDYIPMEELKGLTSILVDKVILHQEKEIEIVIRN